MTRSKRPGMKRDIAVRPPAPDYWAAVEARDASFDGTFLYAVSTTGVYCRPSCPSRLAKRDHVTFHATREEAERAGFRACRRCRPDEPPPATRNAAIAAAACRLIEDAPDPLSLDELAGALALSPSHVHRIFKDATGLTPKAYADAVRAWRVRAKLTTGGSVTEAIYEAGFGSTGRFYATATEVLGMSPGELRSGGAGTFLRFAVGACNLGAILVASSDRGIAAILLGDEADALIRDLEDRFPKATLIGADAAFEDTVARVVGLVEAPATAADLPLDIRGTAFQFKVWQALRAIPPGTTATYSEIAQRIGMPKAVRAVAAACAANHIAVAIPCHRVVRTDGSLAGYRWGIDRKRELLAREAPSRA